MDYFPVADLKQRYGIGKQADLNRRKHLGIVPQKVDGTYSITEDQLSLLDRLDEFLKSSPKAKMTDFDKDSSTGSTGSGGSTGTTILDTTATLVEDDSSLVLQEEEHTDLVELVGMIANTLSPQNPINHWEKLQWAVDNQIILATSEVQALIGTKPKGNSFTRGSFCFEKAGKIGTENGWMVTKC